MWFLVQLEEVRSRRVHTGQHATLSQKHQPTMMFSALPPDAAMATLSIGIPRGGSTPGGGSVASSDPGYSGSRSHQQDSVALSETATLTPSKAARRSGSASVQGATAALSEAASCARSQTARRAILTAAEGATFTS